LPIEKLAFREGIHSLTISALNQIFVGYDGSGKDMGYIVRSKRISKYDIGISGEKYYYLLNTFLYNNKRMFYLRNPYGKT
jgi:hypothetical protein